VRTVYMVLRTRLQYHRASNTDELAWVKARTATNEPGRDSVQQSANLKRLWNIDEVESSRWNLSPSTFIGGCHTGTPASICLNSKAQYTQVPARQESSDREGRGTPLRHPCCISITRRIVCDGSQASVLPSPRSSSAQP
jgi:hypothetical protein